MGWIAGIYGYLYTGSLPAVLIVKVLLYIILYFASISRAKRYWCYFQNCGHSITKLYTRSCLADLLVFTFIVSILNFFFHA